MTNPHVTPLHNTRPVDPRLTRALVEFFGQFEPDPARKGWVQGSAP